MLRSQKGFTLIELLIVIVIIGILAGVLIAVINPVQQQNRARDAGVQATMNKVALAVEGFNSAYGRTPNDTEFLGSIMNATDATTGGSADCAGGAADFQCEFTVQGNDLEAADGIVDGDECAADGWSGAGDNSCFYHYRGEAVAAGNEVNHFRLVAKSFGIVGTAFVYDNLVGGIFECPYATNAPQDINASAVRVHIAAGTVACQ